MVGLSWLEPGDNAVGSAADAAVRLPEGRSPSRLGTIRLAEGAATFVAAPGATVTAGGQPVTELALRDDAHAEGPTILEHGSLSFFTIARNGRLAVRVKDSESAARRDFRGLDYYPVDAKWRVAGRFEAAPPGSTFDVSNVLGATVISASVANGESVTASRSRFSFETIVAGSDVSSVIARIPFRSWVMVAAAWTPLPTTSPTTKARRPSGSEIVSNQSPPTSTAAVPGRYRAETIAPSIEGSVSGRTLRCSVSAIVRSAS